MEEDADALGVLLRAAERQRHVGSTNANDRSSRSHLLCTLTVDSWPTPYGEEMDRRRGVPAAGAGAGVRQSTLQLVDLAGSERRQAVSGEIAGGGGTSHDSSSSSLHHEGAAINKSLLALSTIIHRLSEQPTEPKEPSAAASTKPPLSPHLPFRDSKLTRLLQHCLGGPAHAVIVATVRPGPACVDESLATLRFAVRAQRVVNTPTSHEGPQVSAALLSRLSAEVASLRQQLLLAERGGGGGGGERAASVPPSTTASPGGTCSRSTPQSPRSTRAAPRAAGGGLLPASYVAASPAVRARPHSGAQYDVPSPAGRHPFGRCGLTSSVQCNASAADARVGSVDCGEWLAPDGFADDGGVVIGGGTVGRGGGLIGLADDAASRDEDEWRAVLGTLTLDPKLARGGASLVNLHALEHAATLRRAAAAHAHALRCAMRRALSPPSGGKPLSASATSPTRRGGGARSATTAGLDRPRSIARLPLAPQPLSPTTALAASDALPVQTAPSAEEQAAATDAALIEAVEQQVAQRAHALRAPHSRRLAPRPHKAALLPSLSHSQVVGLLEEAAGCVGELIGVLEFTHKTAKPPPPAPQAAASRVRAAALGGELLGGEAASPMLLDERVRTLRRSRDELSGQHDMLCHLISARSRREERLAVAGWTAN